MDSRSRAQWWTSGTQTRTGFYDVQHVNSQNEFAGRARFRTDAGGLFHFWSIMPKHYPIPDDGPVGEMLKATGRHPNRPAHVHFLIAAKGHETLITHVFAADSPWLDSDAVFGVKFGSARDPLFWTLFRVRVFSGS